MCVRLLYQMEWFAVMEKWYETLLHLKDIVSLFGFCCTLSVLGDVKRFVCKMPIKLRQLWNINRIVIKENNRKILNLKWGKYNFRKADKGADGYDAEFDR